MFEGEQPLFNFVVPDELLADAVAKSRDKAAVADVALMPGTGDGKPPPLIGVLREYGFSPLILLTLAATVTDTIVNGIGVVGPEIKTSFHLSDAGLGALIFVGAVAQIGWGMPVAVFADRGSRRNVAAVTLLIFSVTVPIMALVHNVWPFVFLYLIAAIGLGSSDTVHNAYLADAYPTSARARVFTWHNLNDPVSQTIGILLVGYIAASTHNWRWALGLAIVGVPIALSIFFIREPEKGANESSHILKAAGMDIETEQEHAPKVLLGSAVTRLLRIRSLYYELVAVAILGFAGTGIPLFGSLYYQRVWHLGVAHRADVLAIIGLSSFLGLPVVYFVGDKLFRRAPEKPLVVAAVCIAVFGGLYSVSLYMPHLWMVVVLQFLAQSAVAPLSICIFQTLAATAPPEMRAICFGLFGVYALVFGGFAGGILLGAISDATNVTTALTTIGPVCAVGGVLLLVGSRFVRGDITLVIEDVLERYAEGKRRKAGGAIPALQIHNMDFYYGNQQVLFDVNLEVPEGDIVALLGTNGAGKSTLLRAVAGLDHPHRGVIRIFGTNCTYLEPEQIIDLGAALLVGGKMTFPGLTVRENLRVGGYSFRRETPRSRAALDDAIGLFPELEPRLDQAAGTLSGGEQQMLALARVMMSTPRLLMIDELAFGLAPMTVERLMDIVRRVNAEGATVILVEQSVNRAMTLAEHAFFLERGEVRFDGSITELLSRDDLLRPVFLASVGAALGNGAAAGNGAPPPPPPPSAPSTPPRPSAPGAEGLWLPETPERPATDGDGDGRDGATR
jgi:ABC-type branched-subunit amino acid transport system ATPase component/sugar phosphate permease